MHKTHHLKVTRRYCNALMYAILNANRDYILPRHGFLVSKTSQAVCGHSKNKDPLPFPHLTRLWERALNRKYSSAPWEASRMRKVHMSLFRSHRPAKSSEAVLDFVGKHYDSDPTSLDYYTPWLLLYIMMLDVKWYPKCIHLFDHFTSFILD